MRRRKLNPEDAKAAVKRKYPEYAIEWCIQYKNSYIVMAHPDDGPEDIQHGFYPDPFYAVNDSTGQIRRFIPTMEPDLGQSFFDTAERQLNGA